MQKLPTSFYTRADVVQIARELLGMVLITDIDGYRTAGIITETEAYAGETDRASHAFGNRRTARTEPMFAQGGVAYVYLCYGIHNLFNIVTNAADTPHAILIRAVEPIEGLDTMLYRRDKIKATHSLTSGPGALSQAFGIGREHTGITLQGNTIWLEDRGLQPAESDIVAGTRVGVAYAREDALLPYRFWIRGSQYVSKAKGL